jgi:hypothetical protein
MTQLQVPDSARWFSTRTACPQTDDLGQPGELSPFESNELLHRSVVPSRKRLIAIPEQHCTDHYHRRWPTNAGVFLNPKGILVMVGAPNDLAMTSLLARLLGAFLLSLFGSRKMRFFHRESRPQGLDHPGQTHGDRKDHPGHRQALQV